jgi:hypothetical protein
MAGLMADIFGPTFAGALGFAGTSAFESHVVYFIRGGRICTAPWPDSPVLWSDKERERRLKKFDLDRAAFRPAPPKPAA